MDFLAASATMLAADSLYLSLVEPSWQRMVSSIQGSPMKLSVFPAVGVYILMAFALYYFIISRGRTVYDAAVLGLVIYGVFDMTNMALFKGYKWVPALVDMLWGAVLFAVSAWVGMLVKRK